MKVLLLSLALLTVLPGAATRTSNVLLIVLDDVGQDSLSLYQPGPDVPHTPTLEALAARGVLFHQVWSNPLCAPTRATILTGRYGFRTGVGTNPGRGASRRNTLPLTEITLPAALDLVPDSPVQHAAFGKWHLSNGTNGGDLGPNLAGFATYAGGSIVAPGPADYFDWPRCVNGQTGRCVAGGQVSACVASAYKTTVTVNDALDWIQRQQGRPWLVYLALNAAHAPYQAPPAHLHQVALPVSAGEDCPGDNARPCYVAMIEALDTELGRLLDALEPQMLAETTIVVVGDNGTPSAVRAGPRRLRGGKGTIYEGGLRVPLIIAGPQVRHPGRVSHALVNTTDLFATVFELVMGYPVQNILPLHLPLDAVSLVPLLHGEANTVRDFAYAERFHAPGNWRDGQAMRTRRFKLLRFAADGREEFYNLRQDASEQHNLLLHTLTPRQQMHLAQLRTRLAQLMASAE